jgi:hypothetical protein
MKDESNLNTRNVFPSGRFWYYTPGCYSVFSEKITWTHTHTHRVVCVCVCVYAVPTGLYRGAAGGGGGWDKAASGGNIQGEAKWILSNKKKTECDLSKIVTSVRSGHCDYFPRLPKNLATPLQLCTNYSVLDVSCKVNLWESTVKTILYD